MLGRKDTDPTDEGELERDWWMEREGRQPHPDGDAAVPDDSSEEG